MGVPQTIRTVSSGASLCSTITLESDDFSIDGHHPPVQCSPDPNHETRILSPISTTSRELRKRVHPSCQDSEVSSQSEHCQPFCQMKMGRSTSIHRHSPLKIQWPCNMKPLSPTARKLCLQDLGYLQDGGKRMLVNRFSASPPRDYVFPPPLPRYERAGSDEMSYASMPLRMPIRKASIEGVELGC